MFLRVFFRVFRGKIALWYLFWALFEGFSKFPHGVFKALGSSS